MCLQQATQPSPSLFPALLPTKSKGTHFIIYSGLKITRSKMLEPDSESEEIYSNETLEKSLSLSVRILWCLCLHADLMQGLCVQLCIFVCFHSSVFCTVKVLRSVASGHKSITTFSFWKKKRLRKYVKGILFSAYHNTSKSNFVSELLHTYIVSEMTTELGSRRLRFKYRFGSNTEPGNLVLFNVSPSRRLRKNVTWLILML